MSPPGFSEISFDASSIGARLVAFGLKNGDAPARVRRWFRRLRGERDPNRTELSREQRQRKLIAGMRAQAEALGVLARINGRGATVRAVVSGNVRGEWVSWPETNPEHRILYIHGGSYVAGSPRSHRGLVAALSRATGAAVFSLDYRLAPEHGYPAPIDDAEAALEYIATEAFDGRAVNAESIVVVGDSAGGSISLGLVHRLGGRATEQIDGVCAMSPWVDMTLQSASWVERADREVMFDADSTPAWRYHYTSDEHFENPEVSPIFGDLTVFPPTLLFVGGSEALYDDSLRMARKLRDAGVSTELVIREEMFHVWPLFYPLFPEAREDLGRMAAWVGRRLASGES